jgi:nitrite reductase (NADH) small subunit
MKEREGRFPTSVLPESGAVRVVQVGSHRIGLFRVGDEVHALADRCPHRGAPLCSGAVATPIAVENGALATGTPNSVVRCPWHKWEFEIATGRCVVDERLRVRRYSVRVERDAVVVSLDSPR